MTDPQRERWQIFLQENYPKELWGYLDLLPLEIFLDAELIRQSEEIIESIPDKIYRENKYVDKGNWGVTMSTTDLKAELRRKHGLVQQGSGRGQHGKS